MIPSAAFASADRALNIRRSVLTALLLLIFTGAQADYLSDLRAIEQHRVVRSADIYLKEPPRTITSFPCTRSAGGIHEYYSEGDYWWPDPMNPAGPYIQRDGLTNPDNFVEHRRALMRFSVQVAALTAAYDVTGDRTYAVHAVGHLRAWFIDTATSMAPHLKFAQAIKGKATGRGIGIIDTIHLLEIARSVPILERSGALQPDEAWAVREWFRKYLHWLTTHEYGIAERNAKNNHGTGWVLQVAVFADLTGNEALKDTCRQMFREVLLPGQVAADGSFPLELKRTKPFGYSLFNLDLLAAICQVLSRGSDLWEYALPDGRSMRKAMSYMTPFIADRSSWPYPPDVMYASSWPVRHPSLFFAGVAVHDTSYINLWKRLDPDPAEEEIVRNFPIRQPLLWYDTREALPDVYLADRHHLAAMRKGYRSGALKKFPAMKKLFRDADEALTMRPVSVVTKKQIPPGGDRHDYMSVAPYWWPDSSKPGGVPYVRRDGERNPEREEVGDRKHLGDMSRAVTTLSLAYFIGENEEHARQAVRLLRVWFLDTATSMNPHLTYAQSIRGRNDGRGSGIIDTYAFAEMADALRLLAHSPSWDDSVRKGMTGWFRKYLDWLRNSPNGRDEDRARNNHGTTYDVQTAMLALFCGEYDSARSVIESAGSRRIATQVEPDGRQPFELARTKSWNYSSLNLTAMFRLACIGERLGVDLWHFETADGRSLRKALDWMMPYACNGKEWETKQIVPMDRSELRTLLCIAAEKFGAPEYARCASALTNQKSDKDRSLLLFPDVQ